SRKLVLELAPAWGATCSAWRAMHGRFGAVAPGAGARRSPSCVAHRFAVYILLFHFLQPPERESGEVFRAFHQQQR
ncbi:hypothetical protein A2U01_0051048, partial [Trifolium medium]|nr:hypothetical protein [Trifolium medium]